MRNPEGPIGYRTFEQWPTRGVGPPRFSVRKQYRDLRVSEDITHEEFLAHMQAGLYSAPCFWLPNYSNYNSVPLGDVWRGSFLEFFKMGWLYAY